MALSQASNLKSIKVENTGKQHWQRPARETVQLEPRPSRLTGRHNEFAGYSRSPPEAEPTPHSHQIGINAGHGTKISPLRV